MKIIIIGNYRKDKQESMNRFANMLYKGYKSKGLDVKKVRPIMILGMFFNETNKGLGKWFSYIDKYFFTVIYLFFIRVRNIFIKDIFYHIADHSNAPYIFCFPKKKTVITCHDVLAIRGAFGDKSAYCDSTKAGAVLQYIILKSISRAKFIGAVSQATLDDLLALNININELKTRFWNVVYLGYNASFRRPDDAFIQTELKKAGLEKSVPYLLHVGSDLKRKNRAMLIKMLIELGDDFKGNVIFAGKPLENSVLELIHKNNLSDRVIVVVKPNHNLLISLYAGCEAFVFPSWSEGFGWPVIEAQVCGAPVIASDIQPMPEIAGNGAIYASPDSAISFADAYRKLKNSTQRLELIKLGFINTDRFSTNRMTTEYLKFFQKQ